MIVSALLLLHTCFVADGSIVYIDAASGSDSNCSIASGATAPCRTLEHAYTLLQGQAEVLFKLETDVELSQRLVFRSAEVTLQGVFSLGKKNRRRIHCNGYGGLVLSDCSSFTLSYIEFHDCGTRDGENQIDSTIRITSSTNISITYTGLFTSKSSAITLRDCHGDITLDNVILENNTGEVCPPKAGGLNIESSSNSVSRIHVSNCTFRNNSNKHACHGYNGTLRKNDFSGGGMRVVISTSYSRNIIEVRNCIFTGNSAKWGGGMYALFNKSERNTIIVTDSSFMYNEALQDGGGVAIIYKYLSHSNITFQNVSFIGNFAYHGGATLLRVSKFSYQSETRVVFNRCTWESNVAKYLSPAIDISRYDEIYDGYFPTPLFQDVNFTNNTLHAHGSKNTGYTHHNNHGVFLTTKVNVQFSGQVNFVDNYFSALLAVSSTLNFLKNTTSTFANNRGINGAAIAMYGFSRIFLNNNTKFFFINNTASGSGGGIFYGGIDQHDFFGGTTCFIKVQHNSSHDSIHFHFAGNEAMRGRWIFADSFISCQCSTKPNLNKPISIENVINCIGQFTPMPTENSNLITSSGKNFEPSNHFDYSAIPGETVHINLTVNDDFGFPLYPLLRLNILEKTSNSISLADNYTLSPKILPKGPPLDRAKIQVSVNGIRNIDFVFNLSLEQCPPGYVYDTTCKTCVCGRDQYLAVMRCYDKSFQAVADHSYWAGYIANHTYQDLYFAPCYSPICNKHQKLILPKSPKELSDYICNKTGRRGIMCGQCFPNLTVYYHSTTKFCKPTKNCRVGPLIYFCSEILPVTLLFVIIVISDFSFTSGKVVGLVFLVQAFGGIDLSVNSKYIELPKVIYGIFNLELLTAEPLSFCLWDSLDILDIIAFKYVTVLFAFSLVIAQIILLKTNRCVFLFAFKRRVSMNHSFIHGLSTFLVICYIQCTKTSFQLLQFARPIGFNGKQAGIYTYYGGQPYFKGKHLYYSIIALFSLATVTFAAPCLLLLHPLLLNFLSFCHLSEHRVTLKVYRLLHVQKLVPFIDCFQSCYRDKCRLFAGLYFVYRVALILCVILSHSHNDGLLYTQFLLLLILVIHSVVYPYKKSLHNSLDSMAFSTMAIVNFLGILTDKKMPLGKEVINVLRGLQVVLVYLPLLACIIEVIRKVSLKLRNRRSCHTNLIDEDFTTEREEEEQKMLCDQNSHQEQTFHSALRNYSK